jgi:hypothetical protein
MDVNKIRIRIISSHVRGRKIAVEEIMMLEAF